MSTTPDFSVGGSWTQPEARLWLGRLSALVEAGGNLADRALLSVASTGLGGRLHAENAQHIITIMYRTLARAELAAPIAIQGTFAPVGGSFTAAAAVSKILGGATSSVLIVDPYAGGNLLTDYALLVPERVELKILADEEGYKATLVPLATKWVEQHAIVRPLQVRLAPAKSLHDRLIAVDDRDTWTVGQSFNALATRAPTSFVRADVETSRMKLDAYALIWANAKKMDTGG